jgi:hypothetical protein
VREALIARGRATPDSILSEWEGRPAAPLLEGVFWPAGVALRLEIDDASLLDEVALVLGRQAPPSDLTAAPQVAARVRTRGGPDGVGHLAFAAGSAHLGTPEDFHLGFSAPGFPFRPIASPDPGWTVVAFRDDPAPVFWMKGPDCLFRLGAHWRAELALFLFNRLLRARADAIFFHAAAVGLAGGGVMLLGPRGAGKSTLALALASRGHAFLGDDTACYLPGSGELVPFPRSPGIRPGPRAAAIDRALAGLGQDPDRSVRLPVGTLLPAAPAGPAGPAGSVPLRAVVYLRSFAPSPRLERIVPGRDEVAALQPFTGSLVNAPATRRVFEMVRLLSAVAAYGLHPGEPDETAERLEEALAPR